MRLFFWAERYYQRRPIRELLPLASFLIVAAAKLNTAMIGGLEIVLCDAFGLHRLPDASIRDLESRVNRLDETIQASLSE